MRKKEGRFRLGWVVIALFSFVWVHDKGFAQNQPDSPHWIRPENANSPAEWGIKGGVVCALWPTAVAHPQSNKTGGPRGLLRMGYNFKGQTYLINYIAIEPVVKGKQEFSEISPSRVDGKLGKLIWAGSKDLPTKYSPLAGTRGKITHPDPDHPAVEQLTLYLFMEKFLDGAHPYLKVTIRSDRPQEVGLQIFNQNDSAPMDRCALTATMGNYSRLRLLYLKNKVVDARELYKNFEGLDFIEKEGYPFSMLLRNKKGDFIAMATSNETFEQLSSWPQKPRYLARSHWRYAPFYKVTQYWRKPHERFDSSLHVRVNGRAKYWSGGSQNPSDYISIPGGVAFENFEMREKYKSGEQFYFGITRKSPEEMMAEWAENTTQ